MFLVSWLCVCLTGAQPYSIQSIGLAEGLSNNYVLGITQDKQGFLWFATEEGLNRFDGIQVLNYYKNNDNSISGNELNSLLDDPHEPVLWIATQRNGLNAYNYETGRFTYYQHDDARPESLITDDVTHVAAAHDGNIWLSTYWQGIDYLDKRTGRFTHYNTSTVEGLPDNQLWTVLDGGDGNLYAGHVRHGFSVISIREKTAVNYMPQPGNPHSLEGSEVNCIYQDNAGRIWVGTERGVMLFDASARRFYRLTDKDRRLSHPVLDIRQTSDNRIWIALDFGGIAILDLSYSGFRSPGDFSIRFIEAGDNSSYLSHSRVRRLFQDRFGNVWVGTYGGGVDFIRKSPPLFHKYEYTHNPAHTQNSMTRRNVACVVLDSNDEVWIGSDDGDINHFRKGTRHEVFGLQANLVQAAYRDKQGGLWFGLYYGGVACQDPERKGRPAILPHPELQGVDVRHISENARGNILLCTSSGIYELDRLSHAPVGHYTPGNKLTRCLLEDADGNYWVGSFGDGLMVLDRNFKLLKTFNMSTHFPSNTVNCLFRDTHGTVWVGTGDGLVAYPPPQGWKRDTYKVYGRNEGLANTFVCGIVGDRRGNIWFSTNKGISCLHANGQGCSNYDASDNLPLGSFNPGSVATDTKGNFYFGSIDGLCYFHPDEVLKSRVAPSAVITSLKVIGSLNSRQKDRTLTIGNRQDVQLGYRENTFDVTFTIPDFALKNDVEYAYRLEGLDNTWYTVPRSNSLTFRNLTPGSYQLQLKTRIRNQAWNDRVTSLDIRIVPPFYLSEWAEILYILLGLGLITYLSYAWQRMLHTKAMYRIEKQSRAREQDLNNERLRFYTNITHELRTPLTLIIGPLEDLQKNNSLVPGDARRITMIHQSALRLLDIINQLLEFRKTETQNKRLCVQKGNLVETVYEIGIKYKELHLKHAVDFVIDTDGKDTLEAYYDKEVVNIVLDNLISNALKYTEKGEVRVGVKEAVHLGTPSIDLWVSDTGYGISPEALPHIFERYYQENGQHQASGTGIGLALVKNLVTLHEGEITVESEPMRGSTFHVWLQRDATYPDALHAEANAPETRKVTPDALTATDVYAGMADGAKPILLIVEDNMDIRQYLADSLSDEFDILTASNGEEGKEKAFTYTPDIIVTDIMMPLMDGMELCKHLRQDIRTSHIPLIALTAKDSLKDKEEGYMVGVDSYLTKPCSASLLRSRIHNLLRIRRQLAQHFSDKTATVDNRPEVLEESLNRLDKEFIDKINELITSRLASDKLDINYLSEQLCMSSSTLYRKMKAITGMSANEYIRKIRMKSAEEYLLQGRYSISEVAFKVGINNMNYFRQCFKEEFGCTPSEFIRRLKKK